MQTQADLIEITARIVRLSREENARLNQSLRDMRITLSESEEQILQTRVWLRALPAGGS